MNRERLESNIPTNIEVEPELENSAEQFAHKEATLLQKFRGRSKQVAKALILMTALSVPAEFVKSRAAYAEEPQKIEKPEKSPMEIKKQQAQKIVEKLKVQYLDSNLLPNDCQSLIDKYGSIEVASFWLAQTKIREIMTKIQDEQGVEQGYRTDIISGDLFVGHTDHLQDIARDLEDWSVGALSKKITQQFSSKFTQETMPRDKTKEDADRTLSQKEGIYLIENNMFASGAQLQKILSVVEKIKNQSPSSMKLKFLILEHGEGGWAKDDTIYLRSSIFNTDNIREERFKEKPEIQLGWVFGHEMGHLSFDGLSESEQKQWRELQSEKKFKSMIDNSYEGNHRYPEMFSYYFADRDDMIKNINSESDPELKEKLIKQFNFIAGKHNGKTFMKSLKELNSKE